MTMHRGHPRLLASLLAVATTAASLPALAAPSEQQMQIAKDLFDRGVRLMEEAKCDETPTDLAKCKQAREDFERAYEITGSLGALRNLAYVEKGLGMIASASRHFRDLAREAPKDPKPERQKWADFAREEAQALAPRIPHLVVKVTEKVKGAKVFLDGAELPEAAWNTELEVDPGKHSVRAEAPGRLAFVGGVTLAEKQSKSIAVVLDPDPKAQVASGPAKQGPSKVPAMIVTGVGVVGVGVGLGLGYVAMKKRDDNCDAQKLCDPQALEDGRSLANVSTIVTGVGAAVLVGGAIWWALTPSRDREGAPKPADRAGIQGVGPWAASGGGGLAAFGRF